MKKYHVAFLVYIVGILIGCSTKPDPGKTTQLDPSVKAEAVKLKMDTLIAPTDETFIHAKKYYLYRDSTLIVVNQATEEVPYIELRNLSNNRLIDTRIPLGKGPGEMLQIFAYLEGNVLKVDDFVKQQIALINLDSLLQDPSNYKIPSFGTYQVLSHGITRLKDGQWVFENPYAFKNEKYGIASETPRLFVGDETTTMEDFGKHTYETFNVSQGLLFSNLAKDKLVYASGNYPIVEFYDGQTTLLKQIEGPDSFDAQKFVIDQGEVVFKTTIPYAYIAYCYDNSHLYLAYAGEIINFREKEEKDLHTWIFRFDWDGNFVDSYYCDSYINAMSISGDGKALYASIRDKDNMPLLLKLSGIK